MTALLLTLVLLAALALGPQRDDLRLRELHHGYYGALLAGLALLGGWSWLYWLGVAVLADDAWQHGVQRWLRRPWYRSPGHQLYGFFYRRWAWLRRLNERIE